MTNANEPCNYTWYAPLIHPYEGRTEKKQICRLEKGHWEPHKSDTKVIKPIEVCLRIWESKSVEVFQGSMAECKAILKNKYPNYYSVKLLPSVIAIWISKDEHDKRKKNIGHITRVENG